MEDEKIHKLAWDAFIEGTKLAKDQGLYGAGQDLLKDSFSGNVKGMGPGVAEIEMEERPSEVFCIFGADKTEPGAFNLPMWRMFVDACSNTGILINEQLAEGVIFRIMDVMSGKVAELKLWEDKAELEASLMYPGRYVVHSVVSSDGNEQIVSASTDRLHNIAGTVCRQRRSNSNSQNSKEFSSHRRSRGAPSTSLIMSQATQGEAITCPLCQSNSILPHH